jgi:integrase
MPVHRARALAAQVGSHLKECFVMIRNADDLSQSEVEDLIRDCFAILKEPMDRPFIPSSNEPWLDREEQKALSQEHASGLASEVDQRNFSDETVAKAASLVGELGVSLDGVSRDRLIAVVEGIARAVIEADRVFIHRIEDTVTTYSPVDPIFRGPERNKLDGVGLTVSELIQTYIKAHHNTWTPKTTRTHQPKLQLLADYLGGDRRAEAVTRLDLIDYPDALLKLRKSHQVEAGKSISARQTANPSHRIAATTATTILARATAMFRWAYNKGYISTNPAVGLAIKEPKKKKGQRSRRPFNASELVTLFSSPFFKGCKSASRRFEPGDAIIRDEQFWLPVLAYYTGARLGELVQLHFTDCHLDTPYPHISINEDGPEQRGDPDFKHVKSEAGVRIIPLHSDLLKLGFKEWVKRQKKLAGGRKRLHFRLKYGADTQPSTVFSKRFGRILDKVGLTDPALVFHSFRHTAEDVFRSNQVPKYVIDQIIGHQDQSAAAAYGVGVSLEIASSIVNGLQLPVRVPEIVHQK